jgi:hypothetical protein
MILDLMQFMVLWTIELIIFTSISMLMFGQIEKFSNFFSVWVFYFESALGTWSTLPYCEPTSFSGKPNETLCKFGIGYTVLFLLINLVLFLNLVIALLSTTYAYYEDKQLGLYYEVIVALFPTMEFDDKYGAVVCAQPPFNLMILPFQWITIFPLNDKFLISYNKFLCHLLYVMIAVTFTAIFTIMNIIYVPIAYFKHTLALI